MPILRISGDSPLGRALQVWSGALLLMAPALLAGHPFVFFDTPEFFGWGHDVLAALAEPWPVDGPMPVGRTLMAASGLTGVGAPADAQALALQLIAPGARSAWYAVPLYLVTSAGGLWTMALLQAACVSWMLAVAVRAFALPRPRGAFVAAITLLTLLTPLGFMATFIMPDVLAGVGLLALAVLCCAPRPPTGLRRAGLVALLAWPALVHAANVPLFAAAAVLLLVARRSMQPRFASGAAGAGAGAGALAEAPALPPLPVRTLAIVVCAVVLMTGATRLALDSAFGQPIRSPAFLAARVIADGPGQRFLEASCSTRDLAACGLAGLPVKQPDDVLWPAEGVFHPGQREPAWHARFRAEQVTVVVGAFMADPAGQVLAVLRNGLTQLARTGVAWEAGASMPALLAKADDPRRGLTLAISPGLPACAGGSGSALSSDCTALPLGALTHVYRAAFVIGALVVLLAWRRRVGPASLRAAALGLLGACVFNAFLMGAVSGAFDRYQARVSWLVPVAALALSVAAWHQARRAARAGGAAGPAVATSGATPRAVAAPPGVR